MGARVVESAPAVWQSFIAANAALCQLIVDELTERMEEHNSSGGSGGGGDQHEGGEGQEEVDDDDPMYEETIGMLSEQIEALEGVKKRKLPFADRMGLLGMLVELTADQLPMLAGIEDSEKVTELQVEDILTAALHSALQYGADCVQRAGGAGRSVNKLQQDSEEEGLMCMKLLDSIAGCLINEQPHARRAFLAHAKAIVEWLKGIGLNPSRSPSARQAAVSVLSNLIEADPALLSPPPPSGAAAEVAPTSAVSSTSTPQLSPEERSGLLQSLIDAAFALCSGEEELSVEPTHFSSHNLGTALLDVCSTHTHTDTADTQRSVGPRLCASPSPHCASLCARCAVSVSARV